MIFQKVRYNKLNDVSKSGTKMLLDSVLVREKQSAEATSCLSMIGGEWEGCTVWSKMSGWLFKSCISLHMITYYKYIYICHHNHHNHHNHQISKWYYENNLNENPTHTQINNWFCSFFIFTIIFSWFAFTIRQNWIKSIQMGHATRLPQGLRPSSPDLSSSGAGSCLSV